MPQAEEEAGRLRERPRRTLASRRRRREARARTGGAASSSRVRLEIIELALARVIVEAAERVDAHDHRDGEQHDRALAAVAVGAPWGGGRAICSRRGSAPPRQARSCAGGHRWSILAPSASVAVVATMSSTMRPRMITPAVLPMRRRGARASPAQPQPEVAVDDDRDEEDQHRGRSHHQQPPEAPHLPTVAPPAARLGKRRPRRRAQPARTDRTRSACPSAAAQTQRKPRTPETTMAKRGTSGVTGTPGTRRNRWSRRAGSP